MTLQEKNKKTLEWYFNYSKNANDWFEKEIGDTIEVSIFDVFPNMRCFDNETGCEFEQTNLNKSHSNGPIEVNVCSITGLLFIEDGHHRFNEKIENGEKLVNVIVISKKQSNRMLLGLI